MDIPSAVGEYAEMLALGSSALDKLIERQKQNDPSAAVKALLSETQDLAQRLSDISDELRRQAPL